MTVDISIEELVYVLPGDRVGLQVYGDIPFNFQTTCSEDSFQLHFGDVQLFRTYAFKTHRCFATHLKLGYVGNYSFQQLCLTMKDRYF